MFTSEEKALIEILVIADLQKHMINHNGTISLTDPNTKYTLNVDELKIRRNILIKLSNMRNAKDEMSHITTNITTKLPAAFSYPWCPQIIELNEIDIKNIAKYVKMGQKIMAIKELRTCSGLGLKEAKDFIDLFIPLNTSKHWNYEGAGEELIDQWSKLRTRIMRI